ncbi:hypothetical protein AB0C34_13370 [Nocardia sp. NPDC049220]
MARRTHHCAGEVILGRSLAPASNARFRSEDALATNLDNVIQIPRRADS